MARARQVTGTPIPQDAAKEAVDAVEEAQDAVVEAVAETEAAVSEQTEQVVEAVTKDATEAAAAVAEPVEASQREVKQGMIMTMKSAEEVLAFSQGNVEAFIKSGQIWTAGLQDLSKQVATSAQASYEEAVAAFKALTTVKSLKEAVDLQVGLARSLVEKSVTESNKYTDASFKLAEQAIAPLSSRMTLAVEKFGKSA